MKNFKTHLAESSLSRIMHHIEKTENFGVMSSFRRDNTVETSMYYYKKHGPQWAMVYEEIE